MFMKGFVKFVSKLNITFVAFGVPFIISVIRNQKAIKGLPI